MSRLSPSGPVAPTGAPAAAAKGGADADRLAGGDADGPDGGEADRHGAEADRQGGAEADAARLADPAGLGQLRRWSKTRRRRRQRWVAVATVAAVVLVVLGAAELVRTYVARSYTVVGVDMSPTLKPGDRVLVDELSYGGRTPHRGDLVLIPTPAVARRSCPTWMPEQVDRVVGLPGQTLSVAAGRVEVDGVPLQESQLPSGTVTTPGFTAAPYGLSAPYKVPRGEIFVLGDNRAHACDSRYFGPVPTPLVAGEVVARIWPTNRLHIF